MLLTNLSCTPYQKPLAIGAAPWPNFEFAFLANELGYLDKEQYSLIELTSSTSVMQAFQTGKLDMAFLSLDEVLTLVALGIDLKIISVIDKSKGGDALLVRPEFTSLEQLKWRTIGYENKASGALLLDKIFDRTELNNQTVSLFEVKQNEAKGAYLRGLVDALIVREPEKQQLLALGAKELINSKSLNLPIINVLVARAQVLNEKDKAITHFLKQFYKAHQFYVKHMTEALTIMSVRLQLHPNVLFKAFENTMYIDARQALIRLSGNPSNIELQAQQLSQLMSDKRMLGQLQTDISTLISLKNLEQALYE